MPPSGLVLVIMPSMTKSSGAPEALEVYSLAVMNLGAPYETSDATSVQPVAPSLHPTVIVTFSLYIKIFLLAANPAGSTVLGFVYADVSAPRNTMT